jgi:hypothetical protein
LVFSQTDVMRNYTRTENTTDMITFEDIENLQVIVNEKQKNATTDSQWVEFNSLWNKLGEMIEQYGRKSYQREKKINIILEEKQ